MNALTTIQQSQGLLRDLLASLLEDTDGFYKDAAQIFHAGEKVSDTETLIAGAFSVTVSRKGVSPDIAKQIARRTYLGNVKNLRLVMSRRSKRYRDLSQADKDTVLSVLAALSEAGLAQIETLTYRSEKINRDLAPHLRVKSKHAHESKAPAAHLYTIGELGNAQAYACKSELLRRVDRTEYQRPSRTSNVDVRHVWVHTCEPGSCPRRDATMCARCMARAWRRDCTEVNRDGKRLTECCYCGYQNAWRESQYCDDPKPLADCAEEYAAALGEREYGLFSDVRMAADWREKLISTLVEPDTDETDDLPVLQDTPDPKPAWQVRLETYLKEKPIE